MNPTDYNHFAELARSLGVHVMSQPDAEAYHFIMGNAHRASKTASVLIFGTRFVYVDSQEIGSDEGAYFVGLHELGHHACDHLGKPKGNHDAMVEKEIEAWEWALSAANREPSDDTLCLIMDALSTYTDHAEQVRRLPGLLSLLEQHMAEAALCCESAADYQVTNHGTIFAVFPANESADKNLRDNVGSDAQWFGGSLVVEHRYIGDLVTRLQSEGWRVE